MNLFFFKGGGARGGDLYFYFGLHIAVNTRMYPNLDTRLNPPNNPNPDDNVVLLLRQELQMLHELQLRRNESLALWVSIAGLVLAVVGLVGVVMSFVTHFKTSSLHSILTRVHNKIIPAP